MLAAQNRFPWRDFRQRAAHATACTSSWPCRSSAYILLHELAYPYIVGGGQLLQREGGRPHGALVEVRLFLEAERRVPRLELVRALEEADDLAVLGVRGHPVPGLRLQARRAGFDECVEPLGHGAIRSRHLGDLRKHVAFAGSPVLVRARLRLQLSGALFHRGSFLGRESLGPLVGLDGASGGPLRALLRGLPLSHSEAPPPSGSALLLDP